MMRCFKQQADFVNHHQLAGIGNGDRQLAVRGLLQRHELVAEHQLDRDFLEQLVMQLEAAQVDELAAIASRYVLCTFQVGEGIASRTDRPAIPATHEQRFFIGRCHFFALLLSTKLAAVVGRWSFADDERPSTSDCLNALPK